MADIVGTEGADRLDTGVGPTTVHGLGGDDTIFDIWYFADYADELHGDDGNDQIFGRGGNDLLFGEAGDDILYGGLGANTLDGGDGKDRLTDNVGGGDTLIGGAGDDEIIVTHSATGTIDGTVTTIAGGAGNDRISLVYSRTPQTLIDAGEGDDYLVLTRLGGTASITLGAGNDTIELARDFGGWPFTGVHITDFGAGDRLAGLSECLFFALGPWDGVVNPFATGQLRLRQSGADTLLERNFLGTGDDWTTIVTFDNTDALGLTAAQLDGFDPTGAAAPAQTIDGTAAGEPLYAGQGDDIVHGNDGDDILTGNAGNDSLYGGAGNDTMIGGVGTDLLDGGAGNDIFEVTANGADTVIGGDGDDTLHYRRNDRNFFGYPIATGTSHVDMGAGNDRLEIQNFNGELIADAGAGNDLILSGGWGYRLTLGAGNDTIEMGGGSGTLTITDFNPAQDRFSYITGMLFQWGSFAGDPYATNHLRLVQQGADTAVQTSPFIATPFTQTTILLLGVDARTLTSANFGGYAPDGIWNFGTGGIDSIAGGAGNDRLFGQAGNDDLSGSGGNDQIDGGDGNDYVYGGAGTDTIQGGDGSDYLYGDTGSDIIFGGAGNDWIYGDFGSSGQGSDQIDAGAGDDTVYLGAGDIGEGGAGTDTLFIDLFNTTQGMTIDLTNLWTGGSGVIGSGSASGFERLGLVSGSNAADTITVGTGGIVINGMSPPYVNGMGGDDVLTGGGDRDGLSGGDGNDRLYGLGGDDQLMGLDGDDYMEGGLGDDGFNGGLGADVLIGGVGSDRYNYSDGAFPSGDQIVELAGDAGTDRMTINPAGDQIGDAAFAGVRNIEEIELITLVNGAGAEFVLGAEFQAAGFSTLIASADIDASQVTAGINILVTLPNSRALTITGGSGDDSFRFAPRTMPPFNNDYTLDGGAGMDTLYLDHASDAAALTAAGASLNISGFEKFVLGGGTHAIAVAGGDDIYGVREQYSFALTNALVAAGTTFTVDATALRTGIHYNLNIDDEIDGTYADLVGSDRLILDGSSLAADRSLIVLSGAGDDTLKGGAGADTLKGAGGNDVLTGGDGNDQLFGGDGNDNLSGGADNDSIVIAGNGATIVVDAGAGYDTVTLGAYTGAATLTLGGNQDVLAFAGFTPGGAVTVTDFQTGNMGDRLEWSDFLAGWLTGWNGSVNLFEAGYLRLLQSGADALVQLDRDGASGPGAFATLLTLKNVAGAALTAFNLDGIEKPNAAPAIGNLGGDVVQFTEQGPKVRLDGGSQVLSVTDADSPDFDGGSLRVAITGNCLASEDVLIVNTTFGVTISGDQVSVLGVLVGTVGGSATDMLFSFNAAATADRVFAILRSFDYSNSNLVTPSILPRTVTWTLTDGDGTAFGGQDTATVTSQINVAQVNDIPQLTEATDFIVSFTEDTAGVALMSGAVLSDGEAVAGFAGGSLNLAVTGSGGQLALREGSAFHAVAAGGGFDLVHDDAGGGTPIVIGRIAGLGSASVTVSALTAAASLAIANDLIDEFVFRIPGDNPIDQNQVATLTFNDGSNGYGVAGLGVSRSQSIHVVPVNDAPTISGLQGDSLPGGFAEGGAARLLDSGGDALVNDADSSAFSGGSLRVSITANKAAGEDVLGVADGGRVTVFGTAPGNAITVDGVWIGTIATGGTGRAGEDLVINLDSGATAAQVSTLIHALTYSNSNQDNPSEALRTFTVSLSDGGGGTDTAIVTTTGSVQGVNDAPILSGASQALVGYSANTAAIPLFAGMAVADPDHPDSFSGGTLQLVTGGAGARIVLLGTRFTALDMGGTYQLTDTLAQQVAGIMTSTLSSVTVSLAAGATPEAVNALAQSFGFQTAGANPTLGDRSVSMILYDGGHSGTGGSLSSNMIFQTVHVGPPPITGTAGDDILNGTAGDDLIQGLGGNDTLSGLAGNDELYGGTGNDIVSELEGASDRLFGEDGNDRLVYDDGVGGVLTVLLDGGAGDDYLSARTSYNDLVTLAGGSGHDRFFVTGGEQVTIDAGTESDVVEIEVFGTDFEITLGGGADIVLIGGYGFPSGSIVITDFVAGDAGDSLNFVDLLALTAVGPGNPWTNGQLQMFQDGANTIIGIDADGSFGPFQVETVIELRNVAMSSLTAHNLSGFAPDGSVGPALVLGGSAGLDYLTGNNGDDAIAGNGGDDLLLGGAGNDRLDGGDGNDELLGQTGNDFLSGGTGGDTMAGGFGNDTYIVDDLTDAVIEAPGGGIDTVFTGGGFTLGAGQEVEYLSAVSQSDTAQILLVGNEFSQFLYGNAGANYLDGGSGNDTLVGFGGDDSYVVDDVMDYVAEVAGGGSDIVYVRGSFSLGSDQEVETLAALSQAGTAPIVIVGNNFNQIIYGNAGANYLDGGSGNDTLVGFGGDDSYVVDDVNDYVAEVAGGGSDIVYVRGSFSLGADQEVETLAALSQAGTAPIVIVGNNFNQIIYGNAGANYLDGGSGNDTLVGFGGNDTYVVDSLSDYVAEAAGQGNDVVYARSSYTLVAGQEIETLSAISQGATTAIDLTGNALANALYGNAGANVLNGGAGGDYLQGFGGADTFAFTTALGDGNVDQIVDFVSGTDKIALDDAIFGAFSANAFVAGTAAQDADDRIVYDAATGNLYYDADGNGAGAQILFATLGGHPPLAASDFVVI